MAKQPTITVQVNSQQFQQFATQFNAFSGQIKNLNQNFSQINNSLNRTNILVSGIQASMKGVLNITKSVGTEVLKITKHFISWGTIIGGITALLGLGGGLFGIERLAAAILAKRRQVLGLGGDYGRTQASAIFSQSVIGNPMDVMSNIRMGMAGSREQMIPLLTMGINPFGAQAGTDPDKLMDQIVEKLPSILNRAGPGNQLLMAQAFKLGGIFKDPMDMLRLATKEGQEEYKMKKALVEQYKDQLKITPKALKAWTELELQFQVAKASLQSAFGEKLADLAEPLKHLSEGFVQLIKTFMETPEVQRAIKFLGKWINDLAERMKHLTKEDIENFIKKLEGYLPTMEQFKSALHDFVTILQGAVNLLSWLKSWAPTSYGKTSAPGEKEPWDITLEKNIGKDLKNVLTGHGDRPSEIYKQFTGPQASSNQPQTVQPGTAQASPNLPQTVQPGTAQSSSSQPQSPFIAGASPFSSMGGGLGGAPLQTGPGSEKFGWQQSITQFAPQAGAMPSGGGKGGSEGGGGGSLYSQGVNLLKQQMQGWSSAAQKMTPSAPASASGAVDPSTIDRTLKGNRLGPLSMNNWQMNRTASLTVRNVPGSNIFLSAAGMTS